jgi:Zn-dependent protease/CBS domain-containing protein
MTCLYGGVALPDEKEEKPNSRHVEERDPGSMHIVTVAGIPIRMHFTFVVLMAFLALASVGQGAVGALIRVSFVLGVFACIVLHELGHSVVAQHYGIRVASITLYPIGGLARIASRPKPREEFWIALAGPAVNAAIAVVLAAFGARAHWPLLAPARNLDVVQTLFEVNILLILFNLLPAFPMDGGRVLRAALALAGLPYSTATRWAVSVGQTLAICACVFAMYESQWMLMFVAFFVYLGAGQEAAVVRQAEAFTDLPVNKVMETDIRTLSPGDTLREASDALLASAQHDFPVVHGDGVIGLLTRERLLRTLATEGPGAFVAGAMDREFSRASLTDDMGDLIAEIGTNSPQGRKLPLLIFQGDRMVGMVTGESLTEYFAIQQVLSRRKPLQ